MPLRDYLPAPRPKGRHHAPPVITEAAPQYTRAQGAQNRVTPSPERAGFVWGIPPGGLDEYNQATGASTQTDRKSLMQQLYEGYVACPWAWSCVQAIARTVTSGGLVTQWDGDTDNANPKAPDKPDNVLALERLLAFVNPQQNIRQLCRNIIADLQVFADAYIEIVWWGNLPVALYNQDSPTTYPVADEHGAITKYVQITDFGQRASFDPREIIHISLDAARPGVQGVSPMQAALLPVTAWLFAAADGKEGFRKGLPPSFHADFPGGAQEKEMRLWRDQYYTQNLGARNIGTPVITKGGVRLTELQQGRIADVLQFKNQCRDEIFATFGVPPSKATVIESGNLGGGTGEAQDKSYRIDTCDPIAELVEEAFNYALTQQAFGIDDWHLEFVDTDYRDSQVIEQIRDMRLRNGSWTRNRYSAEIGEPPVEGGDDAVLVDRQNLVLWSDMRAMSAAMVASKQPAGQQLAALQPGTQPPASPPAPDDQDDDQDPDARETARRYATAYRIRLAAALKALPVLTEAHPALADASQAVYDQLAQNFPARSIGWVRDLEWEGPVRVPADHIDVQHADEWAASHDGRLPKFVKKLKRRQRNGRELKPAVYVRTPGQPKDVIVDGHHRTLAYLDQGQAPLAYIGRASSDQGPWDELHAAQYPDHHHRPDDNQMQ